MVAPPRPVHLIQPLPSERWGNRWSDLLKVTWLLNVYTVFTATLDLVQQPDLPDTTFMALKKSISLFLSLLIHKLRAQTLTMVTAWGEFIKKMPTDASWKTLVLCDCWREVIWQALSGTTVMVSAQVPSGRRSAGSETKLSSKAQGMGIWG